MPMDLSDVVMLLQFLTVPIILLFLAPTIGTAAQAAIVLAVVTIAAGIAALIAVATSRSAASPSFPREILAGAVLCKFDDPGAAGHPQPRAPGRVVRPA